MTGKELQALRKFFMLDVSEAAENIGQVSARSWQYWEAGRSPVPGDVAKKMVELRRHRQKLMNEIEAKAGEAGNSIPVTFYLRHTEFAEANPGHSVLAWRLSQSVAAELYVNNLANLT